ncbi:MAG: DUF4349 domain-containing protein [Candidatus Moranbacteria bacterium]|nr:DUF4349 domain-containing protein [Candidatus Moranbacteria bacterium]
MQPVSKKFGKALVVGIVGFLVFFLLVFFVVMFFSQHRSYSRSDVSSVSVSSGMMAKNPMNVAATNKKKMPSVAAVDGATTGMRTRPATTVALEGQAAPMMAAGTKMAKNGSMNLEVKDADETTNTVRSIAEEMGGTITNSYFSQSADSVKTGSITVSVPVSRFEEAFARFKEVAIVVLSENMSGSDVTEQYIDIQARITNEKAAETALQTLLDKAVKVSDIIEITDKLSMVRSEIESLEGQLRYLNSQTDMASITLSVTEDTTIASDQTFRPTQTFKESIVMLLRMLGHFLESIVIFLILGLPMFFFYGLVLWIAYKLARKMIVKFWPGSFEEKKRVVKRRVS